MKNEELPNLNYGDKILVTYKESTREDSRGVKFPEIQQDMGFFIEYRKGTKDITLHLARHNPTLVGKFEDLPKLGEMGPPSDDKSKTQYNKRVLLLDEMFYSIEEVIHIEKT